MLKTKFPSMQHLPWEFVSGLSPINFIAENWLTKMMQMHANLMRPSAVQFTFNQTPLLRRAQNSIIGAGRSAALRLDAHPLSICSVTPDFSVNHTGNSPHFSGNERKISFFHCAFGELN
jgi:hypothetical protein